MQPLETSDRKPLILCVDDTPAILTLMRVALECQGFTVLTADNGQDALTTFTSQPVDAVVLDYEMPGMNGVQVALEMKHLKPHVPILLFTAEPAPLQGEEAVDVVLGKSEGLTAVAAILRRIMDGSEPPAVRRYPRYPVKAAVVVNVSRSGEQTYRGVCTDIAQEGLGCEVDGDLMLREIVSLNLHAEALGVTLKVRAQVRHRRTRKYGFSFVDVTAQERNKVRSICQRLASA